MPFSRASAVGLSLALTLALSGSVTLRVQGQAPDQDQEKAADQAQQQNQANGGRDPFKDSYAFSHSPEATMAIDQCKATKSEAPPASHKKHPAMKVLKGLGKELKTSGVDLCKDLALVFSVQDFDPYEEKAPSNKPYKAMEVQLVDGQTESIIRFPDGSLKIVGGFADGTVCAPMSKNIFVIGYPNGARATMRRDSSQKWEIFRPDRSITVIENKGNSGFRIVNDKSGLIGNGRRDETGLTLDDIK